MKPLERWWWRGSYHQKSEKTGTKWKEVSDYDIERPYVQCSKRQEWLAAGNEDY